MGASDGGTPGRSGRDLDDRHPLGFTLVADHRVNEPGHGIDNGDNR